MVYIYILIFYIIFCPLWYVVLKNKRIGAIFLFSFFVISTGCFSVIQNKLGIITLYNNFFFFGFGIYIAIHFRNLINMRVKCSGILIGGILFLGALILLSICNYLYPFFVFGGRFLGMIAFWFAMDIFRDVPYKKFMRYSFYIYATHKPIQQIFNRIFQYVLPCNVVGYLINVYGGATLTILVIGVSGVVLKRFVPKCFLILNGGRGN